MGQVRDERCGSSTGERDHAARGSACAFILGESGRVRGCYQCLKSIDRTLNGAECQWPLECVSTLMTILTGEFVY